MHRGKKREKTKYICVKQGNNFFCGWNECRIKRFDDLVWYVQKNRNADDDFEKMFLTFCYTEDNERGTKQKGYVVGNEFICLDNLNDNESSAGQGSTEISKWY